MAAIPVGQKNFRRRISDLFSAAAALSSPLWRLCALHDAVRFCSMLSAHDQNPATSTGSARPPIPKWPFVVADATLLAVALSLWAGGGFTSVMPEIFCLGSVALGAILITVPFALEAFPPGSWRRLAGGGGPSTSGAEGEWRRQAALAAEAVEHAARANAALESSARRFDTRFAPLVEIHKGLEAAVADLREATAARATAAAGEAQATTREFERLRKDQAEKFKMADAKITALEDTLGLIAAHIRTLSVPTAPVAGAETPAKARVREAARVEVNEPTPVEAPVLVGAGGGDAEASAPTYLGSVVAFAPTPVEETPPAPEAVPEKDADDQSLMARARARTQSSSETPAVAGIIMARARRPRKSRQPMPAAAAPALAEVETPMEAVAAEEAAVVEKPAEISTVEASVVAVADGPAVSASEADAVAVADEATEGGTHSALRRAARAKALALRGAEEEEAKKNTPVVFTPPTAEETLAADHGPTQGELLAREADTIRRKRASRNPLSASALTANVLIGIGNKPFVRGSGPGLAQDKGVPMEFVEIGQWRWVAPSVGKEPITVRIFKNDEVPAEGDDIILKPGQSLEVSPVFPA